MLGLSSASLLSGVLPVAAATSRARPSTVVAYGAPSLGSPAPTHPAVVAIAAPATGAGYYVLRANGAVNAYGVTSYGSLNPTSLSLGDSATGIALDPATGGYWIVTSNGVVQGLRAPFRGDVHIAPGEWGQYPAAVAIVGATTGAGYYVLRANGAVNAFGVTSYGSLAGKLHYGATAPVVAVALALDPATGGYWIATSTGDVANFNAPNYGSPLTSRPASDAGVPVSGLAALANGTGYRVLFANGTIETFSAHQRAARTTSRTVPVGGLASGIATASTGAYYVAIDLTPFDGYLNPLRALTSLVPQEIDQGVDYCASGPIYALGDGVVKNLYDPGWPSGVFISYQLTSGRAKGRYVYVAENVTPKVYVGERVSPRSVLGIVHDAKTCLETGWADPPANPERAAAHALFNGRNSTSYGLNFSSLLETLGARPGLAQRDGPPGPLPSSWPSWPVP